MNIDTSESIEEFNNEYDTSPIIEDKSIGINYDETMTPEQKVNYLAQNLRLTINNFHHLAELTGSSALDTKWTPFKKDAYDIEKDPLVDEGKSVTELLISLHADKKGMEFKQIDISSLANFYNEDMDLKQKLKSCNHSFAIAIIDDKKYIVDCAYRQFFQKNVDNGNDVQVNLKQAMRDNKDLAQKVLSNGWVEATPENVKKYLDGFIKAYSDNKEVKLPTEKDYEETIENTQIRSRIEKEIKDYFLSNIWKTYINHYNPVVSKELNSSIKEENRDLFIKLKTYYQSSNKRFSLIKKDDKEYLRTESGDIEYSDVNLKKYLDGEIRKVISDENFQLPSADEYLGIYHLEKAKGKISNYIIENSEPYLDDKKEGSDNFKEEMSDEEKISSIVQKERRQLGKYNDMETASLEGECEDSTLRVLLDSVSKGAEDARFLGPGMYLGITGVVGHNASVIRMDGKSYLIDCTYRQFFEGEHAEKCGKYMVADDGRKEVAQRILKYGWIEATPENIKAYLDGFEMGRRNSFEETGISAQEYIKRLGEHDDYPIHIVTPQEIVEASIENNITLEEMRTILEILFREEDKENNKAH